MEVKEAAENMRCLFCEKEIPPVVVGLSSEDKEGRKEGSKSVPGFWRLCELLNIQVTPDDLKKLSNVPSVINNEGELFGGDDGGCDKILCSGCFGCVDKLSKLYEEMESIRKKIGEVVIAQLTGKSMEGSLEDNASRNGRRGRSKMITPVDFSEMFRNLVKESVHPEPLEGGPSKTKAEVSSKRKRAIKKKAPIIIPRKKWKTRSSKRVPSDDEDELEEALVLKTEVDCEDAELWPAATVKPEVDQDEADQADDSDYVPFDGMENYGDEEEPVPSPQQLSASKVEPENKDKQDADNKEIKTTSKKTPPGALKRRKKRRLHDSTSIKKPRKKRLRKQPPTEYKCDHCDATFPTLGKRRYHMNCQHYQPPTKFKLKCDICSKFGFKSQENLTTHLKSHSGVTRVHLCKSCPIATSTLDNLLEHMVINHARYTVPIKNLICPECPDFVTDSSKSLYLHCSEEHPSLKQKFDCHLCQKSFLMRPKLRLHLQSNHPPEPTQFLCTICSNGKNYASKQVLETHIRIHHTDANSLPFKCDQCDKSYIYQSLLQNHIDEKHKLIRYPCPHCSKSYSTQRHLGVHIRTHTGEGLFTCETCGKQFPSEVQLKIHSVVHSTNDDCVCEICGKKFSNQLRLKQHKSSHKEKSLECEYCHMMFKRRDNLRGHLRTHTGERPFVCPVCSKGFNRRDILIVHMKMHGYGEYEEASKVYDRHVEKMKAENVK